MQVTAFRTSDMALATFLLTCGHRHTTMEMDGKSAVWVYHDEGGLLAERVEEYREGEAVVDPREFALTQRQIRDGLFKFLNNRSR